MAGSPVLGVLSVSMTSTRSSNPSHLIGLAGPTSLRLNRMDLPCSRCFLWLHAGGTNPGSTSDRSRCRGLRFRLPRYGIGSATPITIDFGAIFPFTLFRPTTSLSTLRSGRYRTHHARLGSRLLARLYRGRHLRRQSSTHLHGATRTDPGVRC